MRDLTWRIVEGGLVVLGVVFLKQVEATWFVLLCFIAFYFGYNFAHLHQKINALSREETVDERAKADADEGAEE